MGNIEQFPQSVKDSIIPSLNLCIKHKKMLCTKVNLTKAWTSFKGKPTPEMKTKILQLLNVSGPEKFVAKLIYKGGTIDYKKF